MTTENMIRKLMDDYNVAGMSVALIRDGEIVSTQGYGLRDAAAQLLMTADTVLPIGSITKTFTALALGMLVDEGKLDWDKPVKTYIPSLKLSSGRPDVPSHGRAQVRPSGDLLRHGGRRRDGSLPRVPRD